MPIEYLNSPALSLPSMTTPLSVTGGAGWIELSASAPVDMYIAGVTVRDPVNASIATRQNVDVGIGAAAAEVQLARFGFYERQASGWGIDPPLGRILAGIPISGISSGNRIALRSTRTFEVTLLYFASPKSGTLEVTDNPLKVEPDDSIITLNAPATPWDNAASFTQLIASTGAAWVINHIASWSTPASEYEIDIAVGAAASETVVYTFKSNSSNTQLFPGIDQLPILFDNIGNGVRVSARVRSSGISAAVAFRVGYYEKPL